MEEGEKGEEGGGGEGGSLMREEDIMERAYY